MGPRLPLIRWLPSAKSGHCVFAIAKPKTEFAASIEGRKDRIWVCGQFVKPAGTAPGHNGASDAFSLFYTTLMSSNILTFTCVGADALKLSTLHDHLQIAVGKFADQWPAPLQVCFYDWEKPFLTSASLRGETLRFVVDGSSGDELEKAHIQALHDAGATHIRVRIWYGQVGETRTLHYQGGKKVAAKAFPAPTLTEDEQLLELLLEGKEAAFAKAIKGGAPKDALVDGAPLLVHAAKASLGKAVSALLNAGADVIACLAWVDEIAGAIQRHGGKAAPALLRTLVEAPQADPSALWRSANVLLVLCEYPELLALLASREGVDVNAQIRWAHKGQLEGSLLFNSRFLFDNRPGVLAVLEALGARSVPPPTMSDQRRLERMYFQERDADTIAELVAAGVDLDTPLWDHRPISLLRNLFRHPTMGCRPLTLANELLASGASAAFWMEPDAFQDEVLKGLFDTDNLAWITDATLSDERRFVPQRDANLVANFIGGLLARGLDANMTVRLCVEKLSSKGRGAAGSYKSLHWRGPLLGAVALLLCGRGTEMRSICLPLVELLLSHGANPDTEGELLDAMKNETNWVVHLRGDWTIEAWRDHAATGTVLERLRQRQAQDPDEVDAVLIASMERTVASAR